MSGFLKLRGRSKIARKGKNGTDDSGRVTAIMQMRGLEDTRTGTTIRDEMIGTGLIHEEKIVTPIMVIVVDPTPGETTGLLQEEKITREVLMIERTETLESEVMIP